MNDEQLGRGEGDTVVLNGAPAPTRYRVSRRLVTLAQSDTTAAEAIASLRSHLLAQHVHDRRRSIAFCSPASGAGCSYMTANLAVAMAQAGMKTLLLDANLRDPAIQTYFSAGEGGPGLLQCLDGSGASLGDAVHMDVLPNLSILHSGGIAHNAQELLASAEFKQIASSCLRDFDLTIVDTPAANMYADARRLASIFRYALVVARKDVTYVSDIKRLVENLQADRVQVLGAYMNEFHEMAA